MKTALPILFVLIVIGYSCNKEIPNQVGTNAFDFYVPKGWPAPVYTFENNTITANGFLLGKKLFFDPILSRDSSISCGTCHQQSKAFSDAPNSLSTGIDHSLGKRNSPPLFNLAWNNTFMWDGGVNHLEIQPLAPITNPIEMDENLSVVLTKLNSKTEYKNLFTGAFGTDSITSQLLFRALAQYMSRLISDQSKYDKVKNGQATFTAVEQNGYQLFLTHCNSCHTEPLFTNNQFANNGLSINLLQPDYGRLLITTHPSDSMVFKIPSLRNIELTAPYMHDGRFINLEEVLNHYTNDIVNYTNLHPTLSTGIILTSENKADLISFLKTLSDSRFCSNSLFNY